MKKTLEGKTRSRSFATIQVAGKVYAKIRKSAIISVMAYDDKETNITLVSGDVIHVIQPVSEVSKILGL